MARGPARRSRAPLAALAVTTLCGLTAAALGPAAAPARAATAERYWQFVDRRVSEMNPYWTAEGFYAGVPAVTTRTNANMLAIHALAAMTGHVGPSRADDRARAIVDHLLTRPAWTETGSGGQTHAPGWTGGLDVGGEQHVSIDPQVAEGLVAALRARYALGLTAAQAELIAARVHTVARGPFYAWPAVRLNQFNWQADMYAADWAVSGDPTMVRYDYRAQLDRFVANASLPAPASPWLTAGLGLRYSPHLPPDRGGNRTSTSEYGGIVLSGLDQYSAAVTAAGMLPPDPAVQEVLRGFARRQLFGEWTHAGYLNWDSALGYRRWHRLRYWPLAAGGLLAIARAPELTTRADRALAVGLLDRGLTTYERWAHRGLISARAFGIAGAPTSVTDRQLVATRWALLAARAATSGVDRIAPAAPRGWFAHDPDIGRVAVSTERYWTALSPPTSVGYGGLELARLHDARTGTPLSGTGGRRAAAFGVRVSTPDGTALADTQPGEGLPGGHGQWTLSTPRLRGRFARLTARAGVGWPQALVDVRHDFRLRSVRTTHVIRTQVWGVATVRFPVWGRRRPHPRVRAVRSGQLVDVGRYRVRLDRVPRRARLRVTPVTPQGSSPLTRWAVVLDAPVRPRRPVVVVGTVLVP